LPASAMLDRAITQGTVSSAALAQIGALLAGFYERQQRYFIPARQYQLQLIDRTAKERIALLDSRLQLDGARVSAAVIAINTWFGSLESELGQRAVEGRVQECHGDLRPEHICLSPLCIIDALEFSRELRVLDRAEDLAFLRLECEVAGAPEVADRILDAYQIHSGDKFSRQLLYGYQACRALVRAKILAWHILDQTVASLAPWTKKALEYISLAERCAIMACGSSD
jgi:aminoglycoside phosphotransferase family enzyme